MQCTVVLPAHVIACKTKTPTKMELSKCCGPVVGRGVDMAFTDLRKYTSSLLKDYTKYEYCVTNSNCLAQYELNSVGAVSPTLNVNRTLFVIPCKFVRGVIDLKCCN